MSDDLPDPWRGPDEPRPRPAGADQGAGGSVARAVATVGLVTSLTGLVSFALYWLGPLDWAEPTGDLSAGLLVAGLALGLAGLVLARRRRVPAGRAVAAIAVAVAPVVFVVVFYVLFWGSMFVASWALHSVP